MVSIRRRKLLGLCSGVQNSVLDPLPRLFDNGFAPENATRSSNPVSVHPLPLNDDTPLPMEVNDLSGELGSTHVFGYNQSKDRNEQPNFSGSTSSKEQNSLPTAEKEVKNKKKHRRKRINNQEQCVLRGVYLKNSKWQAAIKVDKKQIHLGTVSSQQEAAHLYDRGQPYYAIRPKSHEEGLVMDLWAAFMCGREPNFELSEEEKQELRKFKWEEFLAMTRHAMASKKTRRRNTTGAAAAPPSVQSSDWEGMPPGFSASDDVSLETSIS